MPLLIKCSSPFVAPRHPHLRAPPHVCCHVCHTHARPCLSTGWALNRRFEEILGPLFSWSRKEGLGVCRALVQGKRGSVMFVMVHSLHNNIVPHIATPCCLF